LRFLLPAAAVLVRPPGGISVARPTWKGVISFGMVNIPVHLSPAVRSKDISFRTLHAKCKTPLREKKWCPICDREVAQDEVARGYQYAKDKYVILGEDDLDDLPLASKHTIGLQAFVKEEEIDPIYYEKSYFLEPEESGLKGYALLQRALEERGLVAIAKIAMLRKERLCALRPVSGTMLLDTLYYADEIREEDRPNPPKALVNKKELDVAFSFIGALTEEFDPAAYKDEYREALLELIDAKLEDKDPKDLAREVKPKKATEDDDLLEALKKSVAAMKGGKATKSGAKKATKQAAASSAKKASKTAAKRAA
jgi:DNA end-binding protein Ku